MSVAATSSTDTERSGPRVTANSPDTGGWPAGWPDALAGANRERQRARCRDRDEWASRPTDAHPWIGRAPAGHNE